MHRPQENPTGKEVIIVSYKIKKGKVEIERKGIFTNPMKWGTSSTPGYFYMFYNFFIEFCLWNIERT